MEARNFRESQKTFEARKESKRTKKKSVAIEAQWERNGSSMETQWKLNGNSMEAQWKLKRLLENA